MSIINRILSLMNDKNLKIAEVARQVNISQATISTWKNRLSDPPAKYIPEFARVLGVSTNFLLTGEADKSEITYFNGRISKSDKDFLKLYLELTDEEKQHLVKALQKARQTDL